MARISATNIMKNYIGTKEIKAMPMSRGDYNALRGWIIPEDENPEDEGFLVEYLDSPNKNHPDYENYISWSPKDVFERSYKPCNSFTDRLVIEYEELNKKIKKLTDFLDKEAIIDKIGDYQYSLLVVQQSVMISYEVILNKRIFNLIEKK